MLQTELRDCTTKNDRDRKCRDSTDHCGVISMISMITSTEHTYYHDH